MSVNIKQVLTALEQFAPLPLQESWDNAGLQCGLTEAEVSGALLCLDVTEAIIDEAVARGCNLVVSHHPLLFRGLKQVSDATDVQRTLRRAIKNDVAVISMHTNLDNVRGGVNWRMADKLGMEQVDFLGRKVVDGIACGSGVVGLLPRQMGAADFVQMVKRTFEAPVAMCNELLRRPVRKVALCGGAGDFLVGDAIAAGADAFITGEMHYHQYFGNEQLIQLCVIGHYETEHYTSELLAEVIGKSFPGLPCLVTQTSTNPIVCL